MSARKELSPTPLASALSASASGEAWDISGAQAIFVYVGIGTITGGAADPSLAMFVDLMDDDGTTLLAFAAATLTPLVTANTATYASIGPGCANNIVLPNKARLRWVVSASAGNPVFNNANVRAFQLPRV